MIELNSEQWTIQFDGSILIDWNLVRDSMTEAQQLEDETKPGHDRFVENYLFRLNQEFERTEQPWPNSVRISGRRRLFAIRRALPDLPGLDDCRLAEEVYERHPNLETMYDAATGRLQENK
jgi:hypothetical protein